MIEPGTVVEIQRSTLVRHPQGEGIARTLALAAGERVVVHAYPVDRPELVEVELVERPDLEPPTAYVRLDAVA